MKEGNASVSESTPFDSLSAQALEEFIRERNAFVWRVRNDALEEAAVLCGASGELGMAAAIRGLQQGGAYEPFTLPPRPVEQGGRWWLPRITERP